MGIDDQNVVAIDDDRRVAVQHRDRLCNCAEDPVRDFLEIEERGLRWPARRRLEGGDRSDRRCDR